MYPGGKPGGSLGRLRQKPWQLIYTLNSYWEYLSARSPQSIYTFHIDPIFGSWEFSPVIRCSAAVVFADCFKGKVAWDSREASVGEIHLGWKRGVSEQAGEICRACLVRTQISIPGDDAIAQVFPP